MTNPFGSYPYGGSQPAWGADASAFPPPPPPVAAPGWQPSPYPVGGPGYTPPASGTTAIIAAVLAFLGAAAHIFGGLLSILGASLYSAATDLGATFPTWYEVFFILNSIALFIAGASLAFGGIQMLRHVDHGRLGVTVGAGIVIAFPLFNNLIVLTLLDSTATYSVGTTPATLFGLVLLIFPATTIVLANVSATKRWVRGY